MKGQVMTEESQEKRLGRPPLKIREESAESIRRQVYFVPRNLEGLRVLQAFTGRQMSDLVNEAIQLLLERYKDELKLISPKRYGV